MSDLTNRIIGRLTVIRKCETDSRKWEVRCSCGSHKTIRGNDLERGVSRSCGCLRRWTKRKRKDKVRTQYSKDKWVAKAYDAWHHAKGRCTNVKHKDYIYYGSRGITFYEGWNSFYEFYKYIGDAPSERHTLGRVDNEKGYQPGNVEWQLPAVQTRNKRNNVVFYIDSGRVILADVLKKSGVAYTVYRDRVRRGWELYKAATYSTKGAYRSAAIG